MTSAQADGQARITPEKVQAMKDRIGCRMPTMQPLGSFNTEAHPDTIRHYAFGMGDSNPLFCDPDYARSSRWGNVIAPPLYYQTLGRPEAPADMRTVPKGDPLRGLHAFFASVDRELYGVVQPGDTHSQLGYVENVEEKRSTFGGGSSVKLTYGSRTKNQRGQIVVVGHEAYIHTERDTAAKTGKDASIERTVYSPEEMAAIDQAYADEVLRGSEPRYWEDVNVGDPLPQIVKGPFTMVEFIGGQVASSFGAFGVSPFRLGYLNRQRVPGFYFADDYGVPISAWACHYDDKVAKRAGAPIPYDFGVMRENWLNQLITNWMGDDGFLHRTHTEFRRFNYVGDTQWCRGKVTGKHREGNLNVVEVETHCENQRGVITTSGTAAILLPSSEHGPVQLPEPPSNIR